MAVDRPVGALNMYPDTPEAFASSQQDLAAAFAGGRHV